MLKISKWNDFGGFQLPEVRGKNSKYLQISISGFQSVAKDMEGWLKFNTSYMVYSHIWLNIPNNDCHFSYIFLLMIVTLAKNKNPQKKHCLTCKLNLLVTKSSLGCNIWRKEKVLGYRTRLMWPLLSFGMWSYFKLFVRPLSIEYMVVNTISTKTPRCSHGITIKSIYNLFSIPNSWHCVNENWNSKFQHKVLQLFVNHCVIWYVHKFKPMAHNILGTQGHHIGGLGNSTLGHVRSDLP